MADEFDAVRIALTFPEVIHEGTGFGVRKKGFAWFYTEIVPGRKGRVLRKDVLAIRVADEEEKQALIASDPAKFFTCAHYRGFPAILVNLDQVDAEELTELLTESWRIQAPKKIVAEFDAAEARR